MIRRALKPTVLLCSALMAVLFAAACSGPQSPGFVALPTAISTEAPADAPQADTAETEAPQEEGVGSTGELLQPTAAPAQPADQDLLEIDSAGEEEPAPAPQTGMYPPSDTSLIAATGKYQFLNFYADW